MSTWDNRAHDPGDWVRHGEEVPDWLARRVYGHDLGRDESTEWYEQRYNQLWYSLSPDERAELYEPNYNYPSSNTSSVKPRLRDDRAEGYQYSKDWFDIRAEWYDQTHYNKQNQNHGGNNGFDVMNDYPDWSQSNRAYRENDHQADITNWSQRPHGGSALDREPQREKQDMPSLLTETVEQFKRTMDQAIVVINQKLDVIEIALAAKDAQLIEATEDLITEEVSEVDDMVEHNGQTTETQEEVVAEKQEEIVGAKMESECEIQGTEIGIEGGLTKFYTQGLGKSTLVNFRSSKVMKLKELPYCLAQEYVFSEKMVGLSNGAIPQRAQPW